MNIKVFNIRLNKEFCQNDQDTMNTFLDSVIVNLTSTNFVTTSSTDYWSVVVFYKPKKETLQLIDESELSDKEKQIYKALKVWRNELAQKLDWSAFRICHNSHLFEITKSKPNNFEELKNIKNFGEIRTQKYGDDIMALLNSF